MEINNTAKSVPHPSVVYKPSAGTVNTEITVFVLLTGILVGLLLVFIVFCICKFCIKSSKPLKRQQVVFTKYSSEKDFTWNGNEKRCTKYRSMEPRWSPASSIIPIEYETGSPESSLERKPDEKSVESTASRSNFLLPGDRVLHQCSIENTQNQPSTDNKQLLAQSTITPRIADEVRLHHSGRRLPQVQRQTSIYVTTSDEHLDKIHHHGATGEDQTVIEIEELTEKHHKRPSLSMVTLASPEEMSSLEESLSALTSCQLYPSQTVVSAEVHQIPLVTKKQLLNTQQFQLSLPPPPLHTHSHSTGSLTTTATKLENGDEGPSKCHHPSASFYDLRTKDGDSDGIRCTISLEDQRLVSMMESRCRQNTRWLSNRSNWSRFLYDKDDDDSEKVKSKVRYNDTGSIEEITSPSDYYQQQNIPTTSDLVTEEDSKDGAQQSSGSEIEPEIIIDIEDDRNSGNLEDEDEPLSIESRKLWALRATFEEEEEENVETIIIPTISKTNNDNPLLLPPPTTPQITTTTLESSTQTNNTNTAEPLLEEPEAGEESDCCPGGPNSNRCRHLPLPTSSSETRRQSYQNLLGTRKCRQKLESKGSSEKDNSFDSIETEGSSTDASRLDVVTTSMESTTDNTDSTGEGQIHRLQQMKADSGYKSLETNNGSLCSRMAFGRRQLQINTTTDHIDITVEGECSIEPKSASENQELDITTPYTTIVTPNSTKTASKKRREYTRERQVVESSFGWPVEQDEEILSTEIGTISTITTSAASYVMDESHEKASVFRRFFRGGRERSYRPFTRDFSIDEKSDALYQEFSRRDPVLDQNRCRSPRMRSRHRIYQQQRHSASNIVSDGGGGSEGENNCSIQGHYHHHHHHHHNHRSKVSPEDSIEEEDQHPQCENNGQNVITRCDEDEELQNKTESISTPPHIPIIKVAPENSF